MADNVEVKLGADVAPATAQFDSASTKIRASLANIGERLGFLKATSAATASAVGTATTDIAGHFGTMQTAVETRVASASHALEAFKGVALGLGAALAGGLLWHAAVDEMLKFEEEVLRLENVMGMASEQATEMAVSLKLAGSSAEAYTGVALKLGRQLKTGGDELERLGVATKDAAGNLLPMQQIMENAFTTMQQYKAGTDQAEFALSVFGRSVSEVYNLMARLPAAQARANELMHELNIEMGPQHQKEIEKYRLEVNTFHVIIGSVAERIGGAVLPALNDMAVFFNDVGPAVAKFVVDAIKVLITAFTELVAIVKHVGIESVRMFDEMVASAKGVGQIVAAAFRGDWGAIPGIVKATDDKIVEINRKAAADVADLWLKTGDRIGKLWAGHEGGDVGAGPLKSGPKSFTPKPAGGGEDKSRIGQWDAELKAQRDAFEQMKLDQGSFERWSEDQTAAYWDHIRATNTLNAKETAEVNGKFYDAQRAVRINDFNALVASLEREKAEMGHNYEDRIRIAQREAEIIAQAYGAQSKDAEAAYGKVAAEQAKLAAQTERLADIEAKAQEARGLHGVAMEKLALDQKAALRQVNMQQQLAAEQKLEDEIYQIKVTGIQAQLAAEAAGANDPTRIAALNAQLEALELTHQQRLTAIANEAERDRMQTALQIQSAIEGGFSTLFSDLMSGTKSWKDAFLDAAKSITKAIDDIVAKKLAAALFGEGSPGGGILQSILGSLFKSVPSFDVGTPYVPKDTLALVHRGERIVPAAQNRGPGGSMQVTNQFNISGPVDSRTQDQIAAAAARGTQRAAYRIM